MRLPRHKKVQQRAMGLPVILFTIGEQLFAIGAGAVNEVQSLQGMTALGQQPRQFGKVRHSLVREGRRYWVVDGNIHFGVMPTRSSRVLLLNASPVALKVDEIVRMTEIAKVLPLPQAFHGDERNWYVGLTLMGNLVVPVINPEVLLSHFDLTALEQSFPLVTETEAARVTA